jgi:ABC-type transport system involved in cytochrome bd biosynthesis fused ATPase/permease subunit
MAIAEVEPIEVSYAVLSVDPANSNIEEVLQKIAAIINVQLIFEGEHLPFVPFDGFDRVRREDKVLLYGRSGCGKSRGMYEIIREK